ncbi:MAG: hypothetical protein CFH15_01089 [Alphaproteobacteria bacterium MarineAlpha5_Bin5]|nr:MAG: hypothetical protein CFH15_01089 [Alphaproteobacteria bacterium MarineAlpha5_Bin5]PPR52432.1 MAG: hypothetical protein CFH14_00361 [Alphaproteobacteria bacterium MarineAlpha5_Bin4]|tara:strand:+ start:3464 stop:4465 length:1002 start_codon:yes stop_codon:yes gene_type:complete
MHRIFLIPLIIVLISSINSIAFEETKNETKFIYKLNTNLDDLVLNYCSTYDSYTINRLYSEKKIQTFNSKQNNKLNNVFVKIKNKPLNPKILIDIENEIKLTLINREKNNLEKKDLLSSSKKEFVNIILPIISYENQKILLEREKLKIIRQVLINKQTLDKNNLKFLKNIAKHYNVESIKKHKLDLVDELLDLVDIIPNSIVLAQAANESGWGTSRFAKEYNALFGEYTYDYSRGVIPLRRENGAKHLVKSFSSVDKSVQSYFNNINTHYAYKEFREVRKIMRNLNNFSKVFLLVERLNTYALDKKYIETIKSIIKSNNLQHFDEINYSLISS